MIVFQTLILSFVGLLILCFPSGRRVPWASKCCFHTIPPAHESPVPLRLTLALWSNSFSQHLLNPPTEPGNVLIIFNRLFLWKLSIALSDRNYCYHTFVKSTEAKKHFLYLFTMNRRERSGFSCCELLGHVECLLTWVFTVAVAPGGLVQRWERGIYTLDVWLWNACLPPWSMTRPHSSDIR